MGLSQHTPGFVAIFPLFRVNLKAEAKDETPSQQYRLVEWIPAEHGHVGGGKNASFLGISVSEMVISGRSCDSFIPCPPRSEAFAVACLYIPFWNPEGEPMKQRRLLYSPWLLWLCCGIFLCLRSPPPVECEMFLPQAVKTWTFEEEGFKFVTGSRSCPSPAASSELNSAHVRKAKPYFTIVGYWEWWEKEQL